MNLDYLYNLLLIECNSCGKYGYFCLFSDIKLLENLQIIFRLTIDEDYFTDLTYELSKIKIRITRILVSRVSRNSRKESVILTKDFLDFMQKERNTSS